MLKLNSIRWRLVLSYAAIALLAALALGLVLRVVLRNYYDEQERQYLRSRAVQISFITSQMLSSGVSDEVIQGQANGWAFILQARVRIEDVSGRLIVDSGVPEMQKVLFITSEIQPLPSGLDASVTTHTKTQKEETFQIQVFPADQASAPSVGDNFVFIDRNSGGTVLPVDTSMGGLLETLPGIPVRRSSQSVVNQVLGNSGEVIARVTLSDGPAYGDEILNNVMNSLIAAGVIAVLLAALAGWVFSDRITTPIIALTQTTSRMAHGDLSVRANISGKDEMGTLANSFNGMAEQVEQTVSTLRAFVADAAHELHTPLTALEANIELARDEKNVSNRTRYLSRALEQGQRLEALVKSLLDLSRIEAAESKSEFVDIDLSRILNETTEQFASRAEQTNRNFEADLPDEKLEMIGDEKQLCQVFVNLLENAIKFTDADDTIKLSAHVSENEIYVEVSDTGMGIPHDDLPNLFKRFHRGRNVSEIAGNGLGLAIVKAIVDRHSGNVDVSSTGLDQGSSFIVQLPLKTQS